jgi:hypothetical protein
MISRRVQALVPTQHRPVDRNSRRPTGCAPPPASALLNEVRDRAPDNLRVGLVIAPR